MNNVATVFRVAGIFIVFFLVPMTHATTVLEEASEVDSEGMDEGWGSGHINFLVPEDNRLVILDASYYLADVVVKDGRHMVAEQAFSELEGVEQITFKLESSASRVIDRLNTH